MQWSKITDGMYFISPNELLVNLYLSSTLTWQRADATVVIQQISALPNNASSTFTVLDIVPKNAEMVAGVSTFDLLLHIPYWAKGNMTITVNGRVVAHEDCHSPHWHRLPGKWQQGDTVVVNLPIAIHAAPIVDDTTVNTILYGPLVLVGLTNGPHAFTIQPSQVADCIQLADPASLTFKSRPSCMLSGWPLASSPSLLLSKRTMVCIGGLYNLMVRGVHMSGYMFMYWGG